MKLKTKNKKKNSGHNITICFTLLHVSLSVPLLVFAVFFIPYFNVLRSYFCFSRFDGSSRSFDFDKLSA